MRSKWNKIISTVCLIVLLVSCTAPAFALEDITSLLVTGEINCSKLKLRATPSSEARVLGTYAEGTKVVVLRNDGSWCQVVLDDKTGYMMTKYLDITTPYTSHGYAVSSAETMFLNLYEQANATSNIVYKFVPGAHFEVIEELGEWSKVRSGSVIGYIQSRYLQKTEDSLNVYTYIGENNPYATSFAKLGSVQELGSGKGMSVTRGQYTTSVSYPVLALGIADAEISSQVRTWTDATSQDYEAFHQGKNAQVTINYNVDKLDDQYAYVLLGGQYEVDGLNSVHFTKSYLVDLANGTVIDAEDYISNREQIMFQLEVAFDQVFDGYVPEYCSGVHDSMLHNAVFTSEGIEFYFNAGEILPLHLGTQHIVLPYYRTYEYISLDSMFVANQSRDIDPRKPMIALTFDDGPSEETLRIVAELEKYNSRGTFCVVGSRLEMFESVLRETVASGQEIANHTWNHLNLEDISAERARTQIVKVNDAVYEMTGYTIRVLRPPYGANNKRVRNICADLDMYLAHWKLDTQDWVSRNANKVYKKIMREVENGAIILCHDLYDTTADAVIQAIPELIADGYQLVTVSELLSFHKDGIIPGTTYSRIDPENIDVNK